MEYNITRNQSNLLLDNNLSKKQKSLHDLLRNSGFKTAINVVGGIHNLVNILYNMDLDKFMKSNGGLVKITEDGMNMRFDPSLVELIGFDGGLFRDEKKLGKFHFGTKGGIKYSFNAFLMPVTSNGLIIYYRVVGTSGDHGFGYSFISKKHVLGKRYRQQIFKQILDKFGLTEYVK